MIRITDTSPEVIAQLTAAAYALVYPVLADYLCSPLLQAMQCGTPVICSNGDSAAAYCGNAAVYVNPGEINDIAEKMMLLFKDENKCKELGHAGKINAGHFTIDNSAKQLWQSISTTIK